MLPLPGDDLIGFRNTLNFVFSLRPVRFFLNYPLFLLPGTSFFDRRDDLGLIYTEAPYYNVMATDKFPMEDVASALELGIWSELFTFYLPGIARFFYKISELDESTRRVDRISNWALVAERKLHLFPKKIDLIEQVTQSVRNLNLIKGGVLRQGCMPIGIKEICKSVIEIESEKFPELTKELESELEFFTQQFQEKASDGESDPYIQFRNNVTKACDNRTISDGPTMPKSTGFNSEMTDMAKVLPIFHFGGT